ncbi:MAG: glycosyltransferase [Candidatus Sungbacteria bacterium]|uniref:Glycosyltransferase n=1 Tax=Candidatus Sungiibacteriota bacterium TaxID=2750080 RepID=A0A932R1T5_9BACT|nr:glycosyltransferase [Candidatus Sungbacteria bacterium]
MRFLDWRWWLGLRPKFATKPSGPYSVTVVVPAYNEENSIGKTIESIRTQTVPIERILVVDDASEDATSAVAAAHGAEVIGTPLNQGTKAMAQNYVLSVVTTDLVATIDADTMLAPDAIEKTLPYFADPLTASVCGFVIPQRIKTIWERGRYIEYLFGISIFKAGQNNIGAVLVSSGCFSTFRTGVLQKFGGFKARTMAEDMDFTWEVQNEGYHVYCAQDALCYPLDPSTVRVFISQVDRWYRSFFQNLAIHRFAKNKKLGFVIYGELAYALIEPLLWIGYWAYTKNFLVACALGILIDFVMLAIPCVIKGVMLGMLRKTLASLPMYFLIRPINQYLFWHSLWKEWIKKERLHAWNKGH